MRIASRFGEPPPAGGTDRGDTARSSEQAWTRHKYAQPDERYWNPWIRTVDPHKGGGYTERACNNPLQRPGVPGSDRRERRGGRHVNGVSGTSPSARPNPAGETPITAPERSVPVPSGERRRGRPLLDHVRQTRTGRGQPDRYAYTECVNRWTPGGGGTASGHSTTEAASGARPRAAERFSVQRPRSGEPPQPGIRHTSVKIHRAT